MTSRDLLNELKRDMDVRNPSFPFYSESIMEALQARVDNETSVRSQLASALTLMPCSCRRTYPYHGKGVAMCVRCRALVLWETLEHGRSATQEHFDKELPK